MKILVLEDDIEIARRLSENLDKVGHVVDRLENGRDALIAATTTDYDVLVLDWIVPELDGLSVVKTLRAAKINTPILILTALGDVEDRVAGLEAGADDYLSKPFAMAELLARITALGRRNPGQQAGNDTTLRHKELELDLLSFKCKRANQVIHLNTKEIRLLEAFMRNKGRLLTRAMLLERVWGIDFNPSSSIVETHVSRLRSKIDKPFASPLIRTIRGAGYVFGD